MMNADQENGASSPKLDRRPRLWVRDPYVLSTRKYVFWGVVIGILAGVLEALVSAISVARSGGGNYWNLVSVHYCQVGFGGWLPGLVGGYIVAKRVERSKRNLWNRRTEQGLCTMCGYDLAGNESGRCPECGQALPRPRTTQPCKGERQIAQGASPGESGPHK